MPEHTPSPTPERAIYGFVLYLGAWIILVAYIVWAYVPHSWLHSVGLTYLPQKYWALAIPTYLMALLVFVVILYVGYNFTLTNSMDSVNSITDTHARKVKPGGLPEGAIPPIGDMDISEVNKILYSSS